jgi:endonuclease YncB( thermonuclease family)
MEIYRRSLEKLKNIIFYLFAMAISATPALAQSEPDIENPYDRYYAQVVRVIDGDTIEVRVDLWPGIVAEYSVRVRGIDTPELRGANCPQEKLWAEEAKAQVEKLYDVGLTVMLEDVAFDAYSGRVDAHVRRWVSDRWKFLADELVDRGLAEAWTPEMPKIDWCDLAKAR